MSEESVRRSGGIGLAGGLFLLFLGLRLTDNIDWAWYWVAAPLWMPAALVLVIALVITIIAGVVALVRRGEE